MEVRPTTDLLDRAEADPIGFAQSPVDCASFSHAHLGSVDEIGNIRRIGVTEAGESATSTRLVDGGFKCPALSGGIAERWHWPNVNASAAVAAGQPQQTCVRDVLAVIQIGQVTGGNREVVLFDDLPQPTQRFPAPGGPTGGFGKAIIKPQAMWLKIWLDHR